MAVTKTNVRADTSNYRKLLLEGAPLFDVRAPIEFQKGSVPGAVNLPLMDNDERKAIGTTYKKEGQAAALEMGHKLVKGAVKQARVAAWVDFAAKNPTGYLFCMRGGMRSHISQRWMAEAGFPYPLVEGGYKALRRFLLEEGERRTKLGNFIIVAGRTGVGKTDFITSVPNGVDLEGLANHRGSSFGRRTLEQPTQINFENSLTLALMKQDEAHGGPVFLEDESRRIGGLEIPPLLASKMAKAKTVLIEEPLEARIDIIHRDYVRNLLKEHQKTYQSGGFDAFATFLLEALARIQKRLGGDRYTQIKALMQDALQAQAHGGHDDLHRVWIEQLLTHYYDPMYSYQLTKRSREIIFKGSRSEALDWALSRK